MKYFKVWTIADGYHDGPVERLTPTDFLNLFEEYSRNYIISFSNFVMADTVAWFQFSIFDEDGVALFITNDDYDEEIRNSIFTV